MKNSLLIISFSNLLGGWTLITNLVLEQSEGMDWSLTKNIDKSKNTKRTNSRFQQTDFILFEQKCLSNNSDFSATRRFQDEPLISLQRPIALETRLFSTLQPKQMIFLNHVDLIIVFLMTTQHLQANVLDGAINQKRNLLVNGILMGARRRPKIVCWIMRHLYLVKFSGSFNNPTAVGNVTIMVFIMKDIQYPLGIFGRFLSANMLNIQNNRYSEDR